MWNFENNPDDRYIYNNAFNNALNLIAGSKASELKKQLSERFRQDVDVKTYSAHIWWML